MLAAIEKPGPHHTELDPALVKKNDQGVQRFQFVTNRAQPRPRCREVERVCQLFKQGAGSVFAAHPDREHALNAVLLTPVYFYFWSHEIAKNSVPQTRANRNGPDVRCSRHEGNHAVFGG